MSWRPKNSTLVIISIVSAACMVIAGKIALPIGNATGNVVDYFWGGLDPATIWRGTEAMVYVFLAVSWLIIFISFVYGVLSLRELYKRNKAGTASRRFFIYPSILFGFSIFLALVGYAFLPLTISW